MWLLFSSLYITYIRNSLAYSQFSLGYNWSLWYYFLLLLKEVQFLSWGYLFFLPYQFHLMCYVPHLSLEISVQLFFFPFLVFRFCSYTVCSYVPIVVTGCCNHPFFVLLMVFFEFLNWWHPTQSSILTSPLPPSFLYTLTMSSLRCKTLCFLINLIVLWPIDQSSSFIHFKNDIQHLTMKTTWIFVSLVRFLLQTLVSIDSLVLLRYSFLTFSCSSGVLLS